MIGLGTIINTALIIAGGIIGRFAGKLLKPRFRETMTAACGVSTLFIGMAGAMSGMLEISEGALTSVHSLLLVICLALGGALGEALNLERLLEKLGQWLKIKSGSSGDGRFMDGFITASLTVCIGAMAIVGSIKDGIEGDYSILATKGVLDFVIVLVLTGSLGKGCVFSAVPVFIIQGAFTLLATALKPLMTDTALAYISTVGSVLIFCVGLNLLRDKKIRVANLLPALVLAAALSLVPGL